MQAQNLTKAEKIMLSEKYMAGFIDADGFLGVRVRMDARPDLIVELAQHERYADRVLQPVMDEFGGQIRTRPEKYKSLSIRGKQARKLYERLYKYMVIKKDIAKRYLDLVDNSMVVKTEWGINKYRKEAKDIKAAGRISPIPNFPSRKWLAGYFDGDGCFSMKVDKKNGYGYPNVSILAAPHLSAGIVLIQKAFGGKIYTQNTGNLVWQLPLTDPSKCISFIGYFCKHLVEKKAQAYFLLGCATNGNFRDGKIIRENLMALNAQQHRLNNPEQFASELVRGVRFDIPKIKSGRPCSSDSRIR